MKNILVPTDFSPAAHHAFKLALQLAQRSGGSLTLLHVIEVPESASFSTFGGPVGSGEVPNSGSMAEVFMIKLLQATKQRMLKLVGEAAQLAPGVAVHDMLETGRTGEAILSSIEARRIDLVVVGAQGHTALEHFFYGSHTERLVRLASCPVLAVKHAAGELNVRRIVFPSDFTAEADRAVPGLRQVQALFPDAQLYLLHVAVAELHTSTDAIRAFAQRHRLRNAHPALIHAGSASRGIPEFVEQIEADLVVVPTHGRTGLSRYLQSSIAERVATQVFPPVLTYKLA
ncbi:universal stress protein [Hymenobacter saemangeumensis]|uniref:Universal stress protein n=1 Tax=Hymenobacter saemangeumensis TaxID=1084522 RepID=A0ABP8IDV2_9BACT